MDTGGQSAVTTWTEEDAYVVCRQTGLNTISENLPA